MFENLVPQPADALLQLIKLHNADPRVDKIDLGVGVYRTGQGDTPVFAAIKQAEAKLLGLQRRLREAGWPVDAQGQHQGTPLHWAAFHGNLEMVEAILKDKKKILQNSTGGAKKKGFYRGTS